MSATVRTVEDMLNELAPVETAESYDNVGAIVGRRDAEVTRIVVALDCTWDVVQEAEKLGAELIVSHHPLMFHARKNLLEEDAEGRILCEMARHHLSLIAAHTNLDQTEYSGSAACAKLLKLQNLRKETNYLFLGDLEKPMKAGELEKKISEVLAFPVRCYGDGNALISTLTIAGGADDGDWAAAKALGAQALLTGEVRHHNALAASMSDFVLFDGGHYGTEAPLVPFLTEYLQNRLNDVQYNVRVFPSQCAPFGSV
ncbi:MAG: Nif3-like dinuclear metal center hexameric protein [Clostridia bacterium]|nr:Nif3-like dinuclear metal center hexameric protein [Clostridia bacterium]